MASNNPIGNPSQEVKDLTERVMKTTLVRVEGQTFTDGRVVLDGSAWINCRFVRCQIAIVLGAFETTGSSFEDCRMAFAGPAGRVYDLSANNQGQTRRA